MHWIMATIGRIVRYIVVIVTSTAFIGTLVTTQRVNRAILQDFLSSSFVLSSWDGNNNETNETSNISFMDILAPSVFPLNATTGLLDLPPTVRSVVIDVGARDSDYLSALEQTEDNTTALILVDPLPSSIIPLQGRVAQYQQRNKAQGGRWLDSLKTKQVFALRAALGQEQGRIRFNVGTGPACGSLLPTVSKNSFWCFQSSQSVEAVVVRFADLLRLVPPHIESIHVKIDAEGADLTVLKGAASEDEQLQRLDTIVIECADDYMEDGQTVKADFVDQLQGGCRASHATEYMQAANFTVKPMKDVHGYNMFFTNNRSGARGKQAYLPPLLHSGRLVFKKVYAEIGIEQAKAAPETK